MLAAEGYLSEGASHNDAYALIKKSLSQPQYNADGIEQIAEAEAAARFDDYLALEQEAERDPWEDAQSLPFDLDDADLDASGYDDATPEIKAEVRALLEIAEAMGIDTAMIQEDAAQSTRNGTFQDYYEAAKSALQAAIAASNSNRSTPDGSESTARATSPAEADAFALNAPTREELLARKAEEERARAEDEQRLQQEDQRARADAERDSFFLTGSDRPADVLAAQGQQDIFSGQGPTSAKASAAAQPQPAPKQPPSRPQSTKQEPVAGEGGADVNAAKTSAPSRQYTPASKIDSPAVGALNNEEERKAEVFLKPEEVSLAIGKGGLNIKLASMLTEYTIDVFRELDDSAVEDEDIYLDEFRDEIDGWVIDAIKAIGIDTAKAVLNAPREMLIEKTDLEEETVDEVIRILKSEFEEEGENSVEN